MTPDDSSDETAVLARAFRAGDPGPFNALYERLGPALYAWADLRIPRNLRALVGPEDLVPEVWFRSIRRLETFDGDRGSFRAWIFGFANRVLYELLRVRGLNHAHPCDGSKFHLESVPADGTAISKRVARGEGTQALLAAFGSLTQEECSLLALRGLEGLPYEEVGQVMGLAPEVVRKRWQRLRQRLQEREPPDALLEKV
jgi:RNA polymerase sigma-70 factor (ECF subfamily)